MSYLYRISSPSSLLSLSRSRSSLIFPFPLHPLRPLSPRFPPRFQSTSSTSSSAASVTTPDDAEPRLQLSFTCTANNCGHRSTHTFTKRSYQSGIVLLQCPACRNRHLIADHIGWFNESTQDGKFNTIEDLLRAKGELVQRGKVYDDGTIEILPEPERKEGKNEEETAAANP